MSDKLPAQRVIEAARKRIAMGMDLHRYNCPCAICESVRAYEQADDPGVVVSGEDLAERIERALRDYRCTHHFDEDEGALPLVDLLTPSGDATIKRGQEEMADLLDALVSAALEAKR